MKLESTWAAAKASVSGNPDGSYSGQLALPGREKAAPSPGGKKGSRQQQQQQPILGIDGEEEEGGLRKLLLQVGPGFVPPLPLYESHHRSASPQRCPLARRPATRSSARRPR